MLPSTRPRLGFFRPRFGSSLWLLLCFPKPCNICPKRRMNQTGLCSFSQPSSRTLWLGWCCLASSSTKLGANIFCSCCRRGWGLPRRIAAPTYSLCSPRKAGLFWAGCPLSAWVWRCLSRLSFRSMIWLALFGLSSQILFQVYRGPHFFGRS